ncbi:MAG: MoxR family ATPase [Nitrospirota bacterium]
MISKGEGIRQIIDHLSRYLHGKEQALRLALITFFARGHLLIEDLPGLGKTTLAIGIAKALGLSFGRIQCTSDLLPTDITGLSIYNKQAGEFEFHPGPLFNNIVLIDEINRATPKTQSALIEGMGEKQSTIDRQTYKLPQPFFVVATQNPVEHYGTFPLPESQLDRFMMKISIGYPSRDSEKDILRGGSRRGDLYSIEPVMSRDEVIAIQEAVRKEVYLSDRVLDYIMAIVEATRKDGALSAGISTRGALALNYTARANAYFHGRDFVIPEDVKELIPHVVPHRVLFREDHTPHDKREIILSIVEQIPVPAS